MNLHFTWEDPGNRSRTRLLRAALWRNGHRIRFGRPERVGRNDAWMIGLSHRIRTPVSREILAVAEKAEGPVFFYQTNDENDFQAWRIENPKVVEKALFLRNHWPSDIREIPESIRGKTGFINPLIKPFTARPGRPLERRSIPILFYGVNTGDANHGPTCREMALRLIRNAGLPLTGGLVAHPEYATPHDLTVERMSPRRHRRLLSDARICLALWGNCPLTYRLFEGLSRRCLVVTPSLDSIRFSDCGLTPGRHYIEVKPDLSDLIKTLESCLRRPGESQRIADAGFQHFSRFFAFRGLNLPQTLYTEIVASWHGRLIEAEPSELQRRAAGALLSAGISV
jgi:hypothetical protein